MEVEEKLLYTKFQFLTNKRATSIAKIIKTKETCSSKMNQGIRTWFWPYKNRDLIILSVFLCLSLTKKGITFRFSLIQFEHCS